VQKTIQNERDPAKLQELINALKSHPKSPEGDIAIQTLSAMIVQINAANITLEALEKTQEVMEAPTGAFEPPPKPIPVVTAPQPVAVPPPPPPPVARIPAPKSPAQQAAEAMSKHLQGVQSRYGMPGAKGKEDKSIVKKFQSLAGITADGLAGPGTLAKAASLGQGQLPLVFYWPKGSNRTSVQNYRNALRRLASEADAQGFSDVGNSLRMAANYEQGQSGISQYGPALT
jgi:hypothetical protein